MRTGGIIAASPFVRVLRALLEYLYIPIWYTNTDRQNRGGSRFSIGLVDSGCSTISGLRVFRGVVSMWKSPFARASIRYRYTARTYCFDTRFSVDREDVAMVL